MLQGVETDHGGGKRMKEQGWTWGFLGGVAADRPWWRKEG